MVFDFKDMGIENIWKHEGLGIALTGMLIVFVALILISIFIALLPTVLRAVSFILPHEPEPAIATVKRPATDDAEIAAAIGFVLHQMEVQKLQ